MATTARVLAIAVSVWIVVRLDLTSCHAGLQPIDIRDSGWPGTTRTPRSDTSSPPPQTDDAERYFGPTAKSGMFQAAREMNHDRGTFTPETVTQLKEEKARDMAKRWVTYDQKQRKVRGGCGRLRQDWKLAANFVFIHPLF